MKINRSYLLIALFFLISLIGVFRHELSLDEARPWLIVNEVATTEIIYETRCEMHCLPWFYFLKGLSAFFTSPVVMQILSIILGTAAFALLALYSPFGLLEKCLLLLNYYLLFEFNLIARPYALMTLGLFIVCASFREREAHPARFLGGLLLLAHSTYFGIFLTFPFVGLYLYELISGIRRPPRKKWPKTGGLFAAYLASVIWYSLPLTSGYGCVDLSMTNLSLDWARFTETTWDMTRAFYIIGNNTWNEHVFDYSTPARTVMSLFWIISLVGICWGLRKNPRALFLFAASVFLLFSYRLTKPVYYGSFLRHLGALSIVFIGCMWIAGGERAGLSRTSRVFFLLFLLTGAYSGARLYWEDFNRNFSSGPEVHQFIAGEEFKERKILPDSVLFTSSYLVYSDRKYIDYLNEGSPEVRYYPLSRNVKMVYVAPAHVRGHHIVPKVKEEVFMRAVKDSEGISPPPLIIINYPARAGLIDEMGLEEVASFTGAVNPNEDYYIYKRK